MKAECIYDIITALEDNEQKKLFKILKKPLPKYEDLKYLNGWKGLSAYLGGALIRNLHEWEKEGLIQKYKIGKKVFFKKEEINQAMIPV